MRKDVHTGQGGHAVSIGVGTRLSKPILYERIGALMAGKRKKKNSRRKK